MLSYHCKQVIELDGLRACEVGDVRNLIQNVQTSLAQGSGATVLVVLKNAHLLTTEAFCVLYDYMTANKEDNVIFTFISPEQNKIFPPLFNLLESVEIGIQARR